MKIRITEGKGWYADKVGEVFEVNGMDTDTGVFYVDPQEVLGQGYSRRYVDISNAKLVGDGTPASTDMVEHPSHYTSGKFEVIEIIEEVTKGYDDSFVGYCVGNTQKYIARAPHKHNDGGITDLRKAVKYLEFAIEHLERKEG